MIHRELRRDIDAPGQLVEQDDLRGTQEPSAHHHLLLIAAAQLSDGLIERLAANLHLAADRRGNLVLLATIDPTHWTGHPPYRGERQVDSDRKRQQQSFGLAVLGHHANTCANRLARLVKPSRLIRACEIDGSGIGPIGSEDRAGELGPSRAHQPGDAQDLALAELAAHRADPLATAETLDPEQGRTGWSGMMRVQLVLGIGPDHQANGLVEVEPAGGPGRDQPPVPQHSDPVGDPPDFLEPVADGDDGDPGGPQPRQMVKEPLDLAAIPASWACLQAETRALESAGAITIASTGWATISSTRSTWRFRSRSSLIPLTISSYSEECSPWCLRAPSAIVLKNSLASDFMIRAIRGFSDFVFEAVDAGVVPPSGTPPPHPCAEPSKTANSPQASQGKLR